MTALYLVAVLAVFVALAVAVGVAIDHDTEPATGDRPGNDEQWAELVPVMRSVRRHRRHERRTMRRA